MGARFAAMQAAGAVPSGMTVNDWKAGRTANKVHKAWVARVAKVRARQGVSADALVNPSDTLNAVSQPVPYNSEFGDGQTTDPNAGQAGGPAAPSFLAQYGKYLALLAALAIGYLVFFVK